MFIEISKKNLGWSNDAKVLEKSCPNTMRQGHEAGAFKQFGEGRSCVLAITE
jgi:hypothetical protein